MELAANGSLEKILRNKITYPSINWNRRLHLLLGIAKGILRLHERGILHRDLKSLNVLIRADWSPCLTDFGESKSNVAVSARTHTPGVGTILWRAPEVRKGKYARPADIYSYGMIMYEIATRELPYHELSDRMLSQALAESNTPLIPEAKNCPSIAGCPPGYVGLMEECWRKAELRPTIIHIINRVKELFAHCPPSKDEPLESTSITPTSRSSITPPFSVTPTSPVTPISPSVTPPEAKKVLEWNTDEVAQWLQSRKLDELVDIFRSNYITGDTLLVLDEPTLVEFGVTRALDRKKIIGGIQALKG